MRDLTGLHDDMPNDTYHAQADYLSSTVLKGYLPERYKQATSRDALDFGSAFHTRALGEGDAIDVWDFSSWRSKAAEEARELSDELGCIPILAADSDRIDAMVKAIHDHDTAAELLYRREGQAEESAFAEVDGIPCRARFDKRIPGLILDLKSTSAKPGPESIRRAVIDYGYDLSAAHYLAVADALELDVQGFAFVFVAKVEPYFVTVCDLDETFLARGRALRALAIERHQHKADAYEGATGFYTLTCPRWAELQETA